MATHIEQNRPTQKAFRYIRGYTLSCMLSRSFRETVSFLRVSP
ncbi:MAG: hypothetical protein NVS4B9_38540 [Ktedonobacteraceae bacterium]